MCTFLADLTSCTCCQSNRTVCFNSTPDPFNGQTANIILKPPKVIESRTYVKKSRSKTLLRLHCSNHCSITLATALVPRLEYSNKIIEFWKYIDVVKSEKIWFECPDHVILTRCQITNLVSSFEYLLLPCFLIITEFWNLWQLQGALTQEMILE